MWKAFRGMLVFTLPNLGAMAGFAAVSAAGAYLTGVPNGADNLFRTYFGGFPLMSLLFLFMFGVALCTSNLNLLVSFGCTRRDYFLGMQLNLVLYVLASAAMSFVMSALPVWQNWEDLHQFVFLMRLGGIGPWAYLLAGAAVMLAGALGGLVTTRSKFWGTVILTVGILVSIAALVLLMLTSFDSGDGLPLWGDLSVVLGGACAAVIAASEFFLYRFVIRYSVR